MQQTVLVIGGPTASGKSGLATAIAKTLHGTVINGDSMQVYQGLPILTAQPSAEEQALVPHRLYALLPPEATCSAAMWRDMALDEIGHAQRDKRLPVIVGGTGFYLKTLLQGISPIPDILPHFREEAAALQKKLGNPAFHAELAKRDPAMAEKLHPFNTQRLIRAWEVLAATGKSLAEWQFVPRTTPPAHLRFLMITLIPERAALYAACDGRFETMIQQGALNEVKAYKNVAPPEASLNHALGYPELAAYLEAKITMEDAIKKAKTATRHYAKRQLTWFRHQINPDIVINNPDPEQLLTWLRQAIK